MHILGEMDKALTTHREQLSEYAPKIESFKIPVDKIGEVIGPGGKNIKAIIEDTGVKIDIEDDGMVKIFSTDAAAIAAARDRIKQQTTPVEVGQVYRGIVRRIVDFGAFVEIAPKTDGLVHISQIANHRIDKVTDVLKEGDKVQVKVINVDPQGKIRLSMKEVEQQSA
jgi:polyribonucleotide nucleotidyltransferase